MAFRGLRLSEINEEHLKRLQRDQVQEGDTLEYKSAMYGQSDDQKREMLKDISSMANYRGGYIIIGIEANKEGIATDVVGVEPDDHVERIVNSCLDNIDKRIVSLEVEDVMLSNGKVVVIVSVPESINAPHMVTYKGLNQFWKRHGRQKDKMTVDEIGEAFERRLSNLNRLDRFLFTRKADVLESIGDKPYMIISSSPVYLRDEIVLDIYDENLRQIMQNPPSSEGVRSISCGRPYPTINGLRADNRSPYDEDNTKVRDYIEVFPNGYIEYGRLLRGDGEEDFYFASVADTLHIVGFMRFIEEIYGNYLPLTSVVVNFAIYNAGGMWLATPRRSFRDEEKQVKWPKQHLELGKFYSENLAQERKLLTKQINDRLWQAFHYEKATVFDDAGSFRTTL